MTTKQREAIVYKLSHNYYMGLLDHMFPAGSYDKYISFCNGLNAMTDEQLVAFVLSGKE